MTEKKMTQVQALEIAVEVMKEFAALDEQIEAREVLEGMVAKRKAPRKPRVNKVAIEFAETVYNCLESADAPLTNGDVAAALSGGAQKGDDGYVSFQKVAAAIRRLKAENRVEEHVGEKAKDKKTYSVFE